MAQGKQQHDKISTVTLTMIIYFGVCGGPIGSEPLVGTLGPAIGLVAIIVYPIICGAPQSFITAEFSTCFEGEGGFLSWVHASFGNKRLLKFCAYMNYICMVCDAAVYPGLALKYASTLYPEISSIAWLLSYVYKSIYTVVLFGLLLLGIRPVGVTLNLLLVLVLFPTFLLFVIGIFQVDFSKGTNVTQPKYVDESSHNFFHFLNVLIWNYSAFDQVSLVSSEVEDAGYQYPRAISASLILVVSTYIFPLFVAGGVTDNYADLTEGSLPNVGYQVAGLWLKTMLCFGSVFSAVGLFMITSYEAIFLWAGMSRLKLLPNQVTSSERTEKGVPKVGAIVTFVLLLFFNTYDFEEILTFTNTAGSMCVILQFASTIILRIYHPRLERGYKVPIESNFWYATILFPTFAIQIFYVSYVIISQFSSVTKNTVENDIFTILKSILVVAPVCFFIIQLILEVIKGDYGRDEYLEDAIIVSSTQQHSLLDTDKLDLADEPLLETDVDGKDNLSSRISFGGI
eukprot:g4030.t1